MNRFSLTWIAFGFSLGIALGYWSLFWVLLVICIILIVGWFFNRGTFLTLFTTIVFIILGMFYIQFKIFEQKDNLRLDWDQKDVEIVGIIDSDLKQRRGLQSDVISFEIQIEKMKNQSQWRDCSGRLLVNIYQDQLDVFYGDRIYLVGNLAKPYNFSKDSNFSYVQYLARQGIHYIAHVKRSEEVIVLESASAFSIIKAALIFREKLKIIFDKHLSNNESAMMKAFLLGDRSQIKGSLKQMFVETGTAHILAISGMNVGIVAYVILLILRIVCFNRQVRYVLTIGLLIFYAFMTGASPSVVRATIMAVVFLTAFLLERQADSLNSLFAAALLILIINPFNLFDIGFQLSFVCVFAIIELYPLVKNMVTPHQIKDENWISRIFLNPFLLSLSVWLFVAGLIMYYFKIITPVTVLANLVIVPLSSLIVALGFGLLFFAPTGSFVSGCFAVCLKLTLNLLMALVYLFHQMPWGYFYTPQIDWVMVLAIYLALLLLFLYLKYKNKRAFPSADRSGFFRF